MNKSDLALLPQMKSTPNSHAASYPIDLHLGMRQPSPFDPELAPIDPQNNSCSSTEFNKGQNDEIEAFGQDKDDDLLSNSDSDRTNEDNRLYNFYNRPSTVLSRHTETTPSMFKKSKDLKILYKLAWEY